VAVQLGGRRVAIGENTGSSSADDTVAIGFEAGNSGQDEASVAIGDQAGKTNQGRTAVAIGFAAGMTNQGDDAIAIGDNAGITNQHARSIVLNASNTAVNTNGEDRTFIKPIRSGDRTGSLLTYDTSTGEVAHYTDKVITVVGDDSTGTDVNISETFRFAGTQNVTTAVSGDTLTITGPDLTNYLQNTGTQTIDNLTFNDNIIGTSSNADLELSPGGTGAVKVTQKLVLDTSQNDGSTVTIDATKPVAVLAGNTGADDLEYTLADGTVAGQTIMLVRGNDPDGNSRESIHVIFSKFNDDGTITTNTNKEIFSQYQSVVTCIWNGSAWCTSRHN
jgi:hypothetical protein